ncbi:MAG: DNA repair protein RecO [Oscillospiraceae bacterium]|jgi:DNA repair protein RecO (recombination protein O)|nr:DNA repair protein RecO [Oscillospiraceae bacterium]
MQEPFIKLRALVLRSVPYKESSRILSVLTDTLGRITVSAHRAVGRGSRIAAAVQPLAFSELTLRQNRDRFTLTEAHIIEQFVEITEDLERFAIAMYFLELCETIAVESVASPEILALALRAINALGSERSDPRLVKAAFELRLMCLAGYAPMPRADTLCGETLERGTALAVKYITGCEPKRVFSFALEDFAQLARVCEGYVLRQLDRGFRTLDYYHKVRIS